MLLGSYVVQTLLKEKSKLCACCAKSQDFAIFHRPFVIVRGASTHIPKRCNRVHWVKQIQGEREFYLHVCSYHYNRQDHWLIIYLLMAKQINKAKSLRRGCSQNLGSVRKWDERKSVLLLFSYWRTA